ncbi:ABC transporter ATP-binding protein [Metabacillus halosaccharovorans]|uniref:ABC transporter ATP-binding protein/permease n=1 Tax=Metabacillus halosaccharovorans TaxID=930124 RepID=A0ABT3DI77_9BACI|nr:ABC transporter ATP-binding protein [Metabacillus halosaccharovorans]MCV9886362.1 ABC transporter ATP-binding protein/permease [Metabacillus halosaccharovorans]
MKSIKKLLPYATPYKLFVILAPLLMALEVTMDLLQPLLLQKIIDYGIAENDTTYVIQMGTFMIIAAIIGLIGGIGCTIFSTKSAINIATDIRRDLFYKIEHLSSENRDRIGTGKLITNVTSDINSVQQAVMMTLRVFVRGPLLFIGSVMIVFFQARELFPILVIIIPILLFVIILLSRKAGIWFKRVQEALDQLNSKLQESIAGIRVVKAFVRKEYEINLFHKVNVALTNKTKVAEQIITILMPVLLFVINIGMAVTLLFGVFPIGGSTIQVGVILAFINYLNIILMALTSSSMVLMQLMRALPSADRIQEVLEISTDRVESTIDEMPIKGDVEFRNVSFSYNKNGEYVLNSISFSASHGEKIGIIGATGSGKTTLVKLFPRLYDVDHGEILIDGQNSKNISLKHIRGSIGFVTQKPFLFSGSIKSNLTYGKKDASETEMQLASKNACAEEFIQKLDARYEHPLTQEATNLSGGQKQRLSLARAFVRKPSILILDDATSAVDARSEAIILDALKSSYPKTTIFMVSSKISSILDVDKILVMEEGSLVGVGTHDELLETCTVYQEIYQTQVQTGGVMVE